MEPGATVTSLSSTGHTHLQTFPTSKGSNSEKGKGIAPLKADSDTEKTLCLRGG